MCAGPVWKAKDVCKAFVEHKTYAGPVWRVTVVGESDVWGLCGGFDVCDTCVEGLMCVALVWRV